MEVQVTQTNATMCFILLHGPSCDQQQKKKGLERKKKPPTSIQCLFKFTYVIHAYIYSITFLKQPSTL